MCHFWFACVFPGIYSPWHRKLPFAVTFRCLRAFASTAALTRPPAKPPCMNRTLVPDYISIITFYPGRPYSSTLISDTPASITLQYSCMLYVEDAGEGTGVQNAKASASCVTLPPKGNLVAGTISWPCVFCLYLCVSPQAARLCHV